MISNDEDLKELEKYTFSKYWKNKNNIEQFSQINSFTNNFILNYQPSNNINTKTYTNNIEIIKSKNGNPYNKDINYNQLNINHQEKSPFKNNINNINNLNIISPYKEQSKYIKNYNNINNINVNNEKNVIRKKSFSRDNKNGKRKRYRTPDKIFNYNNLNYITPDYFERNNHLYYNELNNNSNKKNQIFNKINYNESIRIKSNIKNNKKALTPDNTNARNITNLRNNRKNVFMPVILSENNNYKPINFKNNNNLLINNNTYSNNRNEKIYNPNNKIFNVNNYNISSMNDNYLNKHINNNDNKIKEYNNLNNKYNYSNSIIDKTNHIPDYNYNIQRKISNLNINSNSNKVSDSFKYSESCFNNRIPRYSNFSLINNNRNLLRSAYCNKTPSPIRKNNNYLDNFYILNNKKPLKYKRSSSSDNYDHYFDKIKSNLFKLKNIDLNYSPLSSFYNSHKQIKKLTKNNIKNENISQNKRMNYILFNNKIFNNNTTNSCANNTSSIFENKNNNSFNEKNYNMTQPEFTNSLYNIGNINNKNNNNSTQDLNYKNNYKKNNYNQSQGYNYKSYIESYNNESIKENINNNNLKNEFNKNSKMNSYKLYSKIINSNNGNLNKKNSSLNYFTKLSTNNITYDDNNSSSSKDAKNNKTMDTIEEVHINFVNILQNTKNMMRAQENLIKEKIIFNNKNSNVIIVEERDIE